jgi:RecA/RadA recombinase
MAIKKKDFSAIKDKFSTKTKYKETNFYNCGQAFLDACGMPGPVMGGINMFLGHSNTSKTTAMILAAADAQKKGHLPVFIITEKKWDWDHAVQLGLQATKDANGEWDGDFIFNDGFDYIEQATEFINDVLDAQEKGDIEQSILFVWDSVGSIPCKMTYDGKGGKQHNASTLADKIGMGVHSRISKSKKEDYPYYNTMVVVNQPWVELPDNPFGQPEIKAKGGEALWLASSLVFLFGNQKKAGINHIDAVKNGRKVAFATRTKVSILKNHVNGLAFKDGKIIAVPQGYIADTKESLDSYKKEYSEYWNGVLSGSGDGEIELSESTNVFEE